MVQAYAQTRRVHTGRTAAGYALLTTAFLTSPMLLSVALAAIVLVLGGTPLGPSILERLHIVYIALTAYCLVALAGTAGLLHHDDQTSSTDRSVRAWPNEDRRHGGKLIIFPVGQAHASATRYLRIPPPVRPGSVRRRRAARAPLTSPARGARLRGPARPAAVRP
jgi:hypothetical protein